MECGMALQLWACSLPLRLFFNPIRTRRGRRVYQPSPAVHGGYPADNPSSPTLYPAPSGLICFCLVTQGVALGWYISPLQGLHKRSHEPCRKLSQLTDTAIRPNENSPAEPGAKPGRE